MQHAGSSVRWLSRFWRAARDTLEPHVYRLATFFVLSILDDPAMLAFALG